MTVYGVFYWKSGMDYPELLQLYDHHSDATVAMKDYQFGDMEHKMCYFVDDVYLRKSYKNEI